MSDYLLPRIHYSNAELEDKILEMIYDHDPTLFTSFTNISGPKVEIVIGRTTKTLAVNADKLDGYHAYSFVFVSNLASHLNTASYVSKAELSAEAYLKKAGGTMTGDINFTSTGSAISGAGITFKHSSTNDAHISADTNGALGLYGRSKIVLRPSLSQSVGLEITASDLKYNGGDVLHVGNLKNHQFTNSAYGVLLSYAPPTKTASQLNLQKTSMASRYYSVVATTNGYAYVNVPWVDDYVTAFQKNESDEGIDFNISMKSGNSFSNSIPMINREKWGVAKTPFEPTSEIRVEELNSYNDTGRWYGVHTLKSGHLAVNIPWVDTPPNIGNHYSPTNFTNSFTSFGKFLQGTPSYAIIGMSYSFDSKRHIGIISYSYSKIDANNTYIRSAYFKNENTGYTLYMAYALNTTSTIGYVKTTIPKMTNLSYGVAKTYHANMTTNVTVQSLPASPTTDRWYGTTLTKDGKLIVNVPWTDDFVTSIDYRDAEDGITTRLSRNLSEDLKATIPPITLNEYGVAKLAFDNARDIQFSSVQSGSSPVADRWYGIQALKDGSLVTNIPWTDYQTSISGHYAPNSFENKYDKFGKFVTGTTSYAISGVSYSFDNKRHVGIMSYSYSLINADTVDDYHIFKHFNLPYKNSNKVTFATAEMTEDFWYVKIKFKSSYSSVVKEKIVLVAEYSNHATVAELQIFGIAHGYSYKAHSYQSSDIIVGICSKSVSGVQYIWLKLKKPFEYNHNIPDKGILNVYSSFIDEIKASAEPESGLTFDSTLNQDGQHILSASIKANSFIKRGGTSSQFLKADGSVDSNNYSLTSHKHYVGTTQVQNSSAAQGLTGITSITSPTSTALYMTSNSTLYLDSTSSASHIFRKGTTEIARFNTSSNLCIGTANPNDNTTYKLDVGGKGRFSNQIVSSLANGTAPFVVASSTLVDKLNADMLDGYHASYFSISSHNHDDQYLSLSGGIITGDLSVAGLTKLSDTIVNRLDVNEDLVAYNNILLWSDTGNSPSLIFNRAGSNMYDWNMQVRSGNLYFSLGSDGSLFQDVAYFKYDTKQLYADLLGNATTATTLATTRTLWGQNFNGSANVTGNMTSVGSISASGNITTEKSDTTSLKVSTKNSNGEVGIYISTNRGLYDFTGSKWIISTGGSGTYTFLGLGNVAIGTTTTPTVKLDVAGSIKSSDTVQAVKFKTASYEISQTTGGRLAFGTHGQSVAAPVNVGNLLVSNAWADHTNVPTNGIYAKGNIKTAAQLISSVSTGTAPLAVSSTTKVDNLNADLLDGKHASEFSISSHNHDDQYLSLSGGVITGDFTVEGVTKLDDTIVTRLDVNEDLVAYDNILLWSDTGNSPSLIFNRAGSSLTDWKMQIKNGNLYFSSATDGSSFTDRAYFKDGTKQLYADLLGNATSATTLATTRTLWGQNFNGSANVTGDMSSVGSISASGNITTTKTSGATKISVKNNKGEVALYTDTNRGIYDVTSGKWLIAYNAANTYTFLGVGNVGVGCEPTAKLDVNGQIKSRAANGTAPFVVASTTKVDNLNADLLDGENSYTLRSRPDNGGDVLFSMIPYINARVNPFNKAVDIDIAPANAPFGYCFGPTTNYMTYVSGYIPVMPGDIIRGEIYAYRDVDATGTNTGVLYCGIQRFDRNKRPIASNTGTLYFVTSNTTVPSDGIWHKYSGTVTIPTEHTIYNSSDGGGVYYIKIVFYVNYNHDSAPPTYIGGCQFTRLNPFYDIRYVKKSELSAQSYLKTSGGTMTGAINRIYDSASSDPMLSIASNNQDIWLWRVRSADSGTSSSVDKVYGFGAKYLGTGTGNNNSWAMYADNGSGTQIKALEMKQSGDLFAYAPIHWANATALPEDTSPQYILTTDSFTNGGKTKWTSISNLRTAVGFAVGSYLPLAGGTMTGDINFTSTSSAMTGTGLSFYTSSNKDAHISAATNWGLGLYGAGNVAIRPSLSDSTVGITMTTTDLKYNGGDILHVGNLKNHQFTNSSYGVLISYAPPTKTSSQLGLKATNVADRYYGVVATKNGYAYVNVPWTDDYISGFEYSQETGTGISAKISTALGNSLGDTIPVMNRDKLGVANTAWDRTPDISAAGDLTTEPDYGHTSADRWYGVQLTKEKDELVVYVPWTDTPPNQANHYTPSNFVSEYNQFGKYVSTAASYAIIGMSYSFDSKRHIGVISYAYAPVSSTNTYIRTTYFTTHTNVKGLQVNITYGSTTSPTTYVTYNNSRPVIPVADGSSYGVIKVSRTSTITKSTITGTTAESSTTQRYLVSMTTDGFAYVGVPWTDTNTKVTQKQATGNATYSLLMRYTAGTGTSDDTNFAYFDTSLKYNAALNALTNEGGSYFATTSGWVDVGTASHSSNFHTYGNATIEHAAYVKSGHAYIGSGTGSQCHQQYDATNKCLKFIFD